MVLTTKFSNFISVTPATINDANEEMVGLDNGANMRSNRFFTWNTAGRPTTPFNALLGENTDTEYYEWYNAILLAWVSLIDSYHLASYSSSYGASLVGLQNQSHVTSKTVQDLANAQFIVQVNNGSLQNAQAMGDLTTGIVKSTTATGVQSISAPLTSIDGLGISANQFLMTNGIASYTNIGPLTNGQLFIGSTGNPAALSTLTAGANITIANGAGTITIAGQAGTITSISESTGILLTPNPITSVGTVGLATVSNNRILANISGGTAAPIPNTLSDIIDSAIGNAQGDILYRNSSGWVVLVPGTSGYFLKTQGAAANPIWSAGPGVVNIATNDGVTGGPITSTGTIGLASITDGTLLANVSGGSLYPSSTTLTALIDYTLGSTQGEVLYRNGSVWTVLAPGTAGQVLTTGGAAANPSWQDGGETGTVTSVGTGTGLTGGPITTTGTISFANVADARVLANISGGAAAPVPNTLTAIIDYTIGSTQGDLLYRNGTVWTVLGPGTSGQVLTTGGSGANPAWADGGETGTVTSVATNNGITGGTITTTGTIGLANVSDSTILSNISGGSTYPTPNTLTGILDHILGSAQGDIIFRGSSVWEVLAPGMSGQVLTTGGASADVTWTTNGAGTVTSVATNNGLTGGTITSTGTLGLAAIADATLLANVSGGSLYPSSTTLTALIDYAIGSTQGDILYRNGSAWVVLAPGTSGYVLTTGGASANPSWVANGSGTVTSVATNNGLTGGTITTTGTLGLAAIADGDLLANVSGGSLYPSATTLTDLIDYTLGSTQGDILYRDSSAWKVLGPGTSGYVLATQGAAANPHWIAASSGSGTVNSGTALQLAYYATTGAAVSGMPSSGYAGVTDASNATAGNVGEVMTANLQSGSGVNLPNNTPENVLSLNLTAGDWDVHGNVAIIWTGTSLQSTAWLSLTSASSPDYSLENVLVWVMSTGPVTGFTVPLLRVNVTTTTTVYLSALSQQNTGTASASGTIYARRMR